MENQTLDGVTLVAMKNGQPVANQAETVTAMLRPVIAAVLKHADSGIDLVTDEHPMTTAARKRRIVDLEIECATLRHGLRLADRRYEEALAASASDKQKSGVVDAQEEKP